MRWLHSTIDAGVNSHHRGASWPGCVTAFQVEALGAGAVSAANCDTCSWTAMRVDVMHKALMIRKEADTKVTTAGVCGNMTPLGGWAADKVCGCRTFTTVWPVTMNNDPERWSAMPSGEDMVPKPQLPKTEAGESGQRRGHIGPRPRSELTAFLLFPCVTGCPCEHADFARAPSTPHARICRHYRGNFARWVRLGGQTGTDDSTRVCCYRRGFGAQLHTGYATAARLQ